MASLLRILEARQCRFTFPSNPIFTKSEWCKRRHFESSTNSESIESEIEPPQYDRQRSLAEDSVAREENSSTPDNDFRMNVRTAGPVRFVGVGYDDVHLAARQDGGQGQAEGTHVHNMDHSNQDSNRPMGTYRVLRDDVQNIDRPMGGYRVLRINNVMGKKVEQYVMDTEPPKWSITSRQMYSTPWPLTSTKWAQTGFPKHLSPAAYGDLPSRIHDAEKYERSQAYSPPGNTLLDKSAERIAFQKLRKALRLRDPQECFMALIELSTMTAHEEMSSLLLQISPNAFSEILRLIDPEHFLGRHGNLRQEFSPHYTRVLRVGTVGDHGFHQFYVKYLHHIYRIFVFRRSINPLLPPTLSDFKMLLKAARWTGNQAMAESTWSSLLKSHFHADLGSRVKPDTECFNHYLATLCWSDLLNPLHAHQLRILQSNIQPRTWNRPPRTLAGHRVGPDDGIKVNVSRQFRKMAELGLVADVQTLCILMVASGREGDLPTAEAILKRVWNIDVEKVMSEDQPRIEDIENMSPSSSLYPSAELLRTIAHIYGINSAIPTALRLVDYVARAYSIEIPSQIWFELLQWTNVLATKRRGLKAIESDVLVGQLPPAAVGNLWSIMTSEPYNIKPSMRMYGLFIGNLISNERYGQAQLRMQEALTLHKRYVHTLMTAKHLLLGGLRYKPNSMVTEKHQRDYNFRQLQVQRNRQYIRLWVARLIKKGSKSMEKVNAWSRRQVPDLVKQWMSFVPQVVSYRIDTGVVELYTGARQYNTMRMLRRKFSNTPWALGRKRLLRRLLIAKRKRASSNVHLQNAVQDHAEQVPEVDESPEVWQWGVGP